MTKLARLLVLLCLVGCGSQDVVVGELPSSSGAGSGGSGGGEAGGHGGESPVGSCTGNADCPPLAFCQKTVCGQPTGVCQPRPIQCPDEQQERCGCDGVTYWNDCLRRQLGVAASSDGFCLSDAMPCGGPAGDCSLPGASCAHLLPPELACNQAAAGMCWLLPPGCPPGAKAQGWEACGPGNPCTSLCKAIRSELPHRLRTGPSCSTEP